MADFVSMHIIESKEQLGNYVCTIMFCQVLFFVNLCLQFASLVKWYDQVELLVHWTEVDLKWIHYKRMVKFTKDVKLTLSVILIARLKSDRLHCKLDLVIVFLLNKFDDAVLS